MQERTYTHIVRKGDAAQPYYWRTEAGNGEPVASSHDQYFSLVDALHGLALFAANAAAAPINDRTDAAGDGQLAGFEFEIDLDVAGRPIWRFQAPNNKIIATGAEPFSSKRAAREAIGRVKANVAEAEVVDETGDPVDVEECAAGGVRPPRARRYRIRVDREKYDVDRARLAGREVLATAGLSPAERYQLYQKDRDGQKRAIGLDETVDLTRPGVERFQTIEHAVTDGVTGAETGPPQSGGPDA